MRALHREDGSAPVPAQDPAPDHRPGHHGHRAPVTARPRQQFHLTATADVPDQEEGPAVPVGVDQLELGVVALGDRTDVPPAAVGADGHGDQAGAAQPGVGHQVDDHGGVGLLRGGPQDTEMGGAHRRKRQQVFFVPRGAVEQPAAFGPAGPVTAQDEALVLGEIQHAEERAGRQVLGGPGRRVEEHAAVRPAGPAVEVLVHRHRQPMAAAGPGPEHGVSAVAPHDAAPVGAVRAHHPDL